MSYPVKPHICDCARVQYNSDSSTPETLVLESTGSTTLTTPSSLSSPLSLTTMPVLTSSSPTAPSTSTVPIQLHQTAGFATFLAQGTTLPPGTAVQIGTFPSQANLQQTSNQTQAAVYRLSPTVVSIPNANQTVTNQTNQNTVTMVPTSQPGLSMVSGNMVIPAQTAVPTTTATVMYQTNQGVVYATPSTTSLPESVILNLGQQDQNNTAQQFITIPVPVSLTPSQQQQLVQGTMSSPSTEVSTSTSRLSSDILSINKRGKHRK